MIFGEYSEILKKNENLAWFYIKLFFNFKIFQPFSIILSNHKAENGKKPIFESGKTKQK
jgi:hypothetical protein